jgi:hypothetical protein
MNIQPGWEMAKVVVVMMIYTHSGCELGRLAAGDMMLCT